jgi:hypothetical protein
MFLQKKHCRISYRCAVIVILAAACFSNALAQNTPRASSGWIVLPASEYAAIRNAAYPTEPAPEAPPIQATLTKINYDLKVQGELAVGQATLSVDVMKPGWVRIPIPSSLLIRDARLDGKPVSPVVTDKLSGTKSLVFQHQSHAEVSLDIVIKTEVSDGNESLELPSTQAGITRASIVLPRIGVEVTLEGGLLAEQSVTGSESKWIGYGQGTQPLVFSWTKKTEDLRVTEPLRMRGSLTELVGLGEDNTSVQAQIEMEILQGAAKEIKLALPEKVVINQVGGPMVADWEMKTGELIVTLMEPAEKEVKFVLAGEIRMPRDGKIEIPFLKLRDAERETGGIAVDVLGAGEIKDRKFIGLEAADATDLKEVVSMRQSPSMIAYRFKSGDIKAARSLTVQVARYKQESVLTANVEEARYRVLMSDEGKALVQARYAMRNNRKNFLKIALPKDAVIWSATLSGRPVRPGKADDSSLLLPLEKGRAGTEAPLFAAEIFYFLRSPKWTENGKIQLALPSLDLPISKTGIEYFHPPLYKVTLEPGPCRLQPYQEPSSYVLQSHGSGGVGSGSSTGTIMRTDHVVQLPLASNDVMDLINIMGGVVKAENPLFSNNDATFAGVQASSINIQKGGVNDVSSSAGMVLVPVDAERRSAGILPIKLSFPVFGQSIYLASELTAENQAPVIDFSYEADKKGGSR